MVGGGGMHDIAIDNSGNAWLTDSVRNKFRTLAKVDLKTGQVTGFKLTAPDGTFARASHGIYKDRQGILWFDTDGSLGRLDPATETFEVFTPPQPLRVGGSLEEDGKGAIWLPSRHGALRFDPVTKKFRYFQNKTIGDGNSYGVAGDALGNGWWAQFNQDIVGHANPVTGKVDEVRMNPPWNTNDENRLEFLTPENVEFYHNAGIGTFTGTFARPGAQAPRRMSSERNGNYVWVANWWGNNLARIDIRTLEPKYYKLPFNTHPYATVVDKSGMVWTNLSSDDAVARFNPKTEQWAIFKLPSLGAELRYITVDNAGGPDVWVVYREASKATRIQFRTEEQIQALKSAN
jgi:virginiamycin B lyase